MNIPSVMPVINWRNQKRKKGVYPIHLCVYISGQSRRYYPVKVPQKVRLDQWTGKDSCWVSNTHPFAFEINTRIAELKGKITDLTKRFYNQNKPITFYAIEREILRKGDRTLLNNYFRNYIDHPPENVTLDEVTWEKYEAFLMHLNNFNPKIRFSDIDDTMVARIEITLLTKKDVKVNWKHQPLNLTLINLKLCSHMLLKKIIYWTHRKLSNFLKRCLSLY